MSEALHVMHLMRHGEIAWSLSGQDAGQCRPALDLTRRGDVWSFRADMFRGGIGGLEADTLSFLKIGATPMDVFVMRHGETTWSLSGQHTSTTDIPLTENGRRAAERLRPVLAKEKFALVLVSPMQRARETCNLAGLGAGAIVDPNLMEWNYGDYEGLTPALIQDRAPGWLLFRDGCPHGERSEQVTERADQVIARAHAAKGNVALFAHGHILCVLVARWIGLPAGAGQHFVLDTGTLSVLGHYHNIPAIRIWNGPLV